MSLSVNQLIAEIETDFSTFAESGDLDKASMTRWITNEMKRFGNNIQVLHEKVIDIKNSSYTFDEKFRNLRLAYKVDPLGVVLEDGCTKDCLRESFVSNTRIINEAYFNDVTLEYVKSCNSKIVQETITLKTGRATLCYTPQWLTIVKGIKRDGIATDCVNLNKNIRHKSPYEISITGNTLNANFREGQIYVQYYSFEEDEDGSILIPDSGAGHLEKFLEFNTKSRIAENLIANNKNPQALSQLLPYYQQQAEKYFSNAMTEAKFKGLGQNWIAKTRVRNRAQMSRFNLPT